MFRFGISSDYIIMRSSSINIHRPFHASTIVVLTLGVCLSLGCRACGPKQEPAVPISAPPVYSPDATISDRPPALILGSSPLPSPPPSSVPLPSASPSSFAPPPTSSLSASPLPDNAKRIEAFRPITPTAEVSRSVPGSIPQTTILSQRETPVSIPLPRENVEELNARIASLEKKLSETEKKLQDTQSAAKAQAAKPVPPPVSAPAPSPALVPVQGAVKPTEKLVDTSAAVKKTPPKALPSFAVPGVTVASDQDCIRVQIVDEALFVSGAWNFNTMAEETLRKIVSGIRETYPDSSIEVEGHTDNLQVDPQNKTQKHDIASYKSTLVMQYVVNTLLWKPDKIKSSSYGASRPIADNGTPEGRARNNRIEIVVKP